MDSVDAVSAYLNQAYLHNQVVELSLLDGQIVHGLVSAVSTNYLYFTKRGGSLLAIPPEMIMSVRFLKEKWWNQ